MGKQRIVIWIAGYFLLLTGVMGQSQLAATEGIAGDSAGLRTLAEKLMDPQFREQIYRSRALWPRQEEYYAVFDSAFAAELYRHHRRLYNNLSVVVAPRQRHEREIHLWQCLSDSFAAYRGDARFFPGGYRELACSHHLRPGVMCYRFRYVVPGKTIGTGWDLFVFLNGHWCFFPRPWQLLLQQTRRK